MELPTLLSIQHDYYYSQEYGEKEPIQFSLRKEALYKISKERTQISYNDIKTMASEWDFFMPENKP